MKVQSGYLLQPGEAFALHLSKRGDGDSRMGPFESATERDVSALSHGRQYIRSYLYTHHSTILEAKTDLFIHYCHCTCDQHHCVLSSFGRVDHHTPSYSYFVKSNGSWQRGGYAQDSATRISTRIATSIAGRIDTRTEARTAMRILIKIISRTRGRI